MSPKIAISARSRSRTGRSTAWTTTHLPSAELCNEHRTLLGLGGRALAPPRRASPSEPARASARRGDGGSRRGGDDEAHPERDRGHDAGDAPSSVKASGTDAITLGVRVRRRPCGDHMWRRSPPGVSRGSMSRRSHHRAAFGVGGGELELDAGGLRRQREQPRQLVVGDGDGGRLMR